MASNASMVSGVELRGELRPGQERPLTAPALAFLAHLHRMSEETRQSLLRARAERLHWGAPGFAAETSAIRAGQWRVAANLPASGQCPPWHMVAPEREALAHALRGGDGPLLVSLEDGLAPAFGHLLDAQAALAEALAAGSKPPSLFVQPRGWHLPEAHLLIDGAEIPASIFDFGLYFFHNARPLLQRGAAPSLALPKLEHPLEARLWNNLFVLAQSILDLPLGSIRAAVVVETVPAAFMADEILHELRDHAVALAFDREDYLFSYLKSFANDAGRLLPDYERISDSTPLLAAATAHLHALCARRGVAAIGLRQQAAAGDLLAHPEGAITSAGLAENVFAAIGHLAHWLGNADAPSLPADTAAAEVRRAQLWQWRRHGAILEDGTVMTARRINNEIKAQLGLWQQRVGAQAYQNGRYREAATILLDLVLEPQLPAFFTLPCYRQFLVGKQA